MTVNALNFCSFATSQCPSSLLQADSDQSRDDKILVAVPGVQDGNVNVTSLPDEQRITTIIPPEDVKSGMVMAIALHIRPEDDSLRVIAGYESGYVCVFAKQAGTKHWQATYTHNAHTQPVLSIDMAPSLGYFFSSSADAIIVRHPLDLESSDTKPIQTKHAGQQSLKVRSDARIFATAGWDGRVRVYSARTMKELAVLKWHKEGCYALTFADVSVATGDMSETSQGAGAVAKRHLTVAEQRHKKTRETHWLAAGSKDGKVSLWEVY